MPTRNINLTEELDNAIKARVSSGSYENASEVVRDALRALTQREREDAAKLEALRDAIREGDQSPIASEGVLQRVRARITNPA